MDIARGACHLANFRRSRPLHFRPEAIVLHSAGGSLAGLAMEMQDANSGMSCHYGIDESGAVVQFVDDTDTAFHAGVVEEPNWRLLKPGVNPNYYTVAITAAGLATRDWTPQQYSAAASLIAALCDRWGIPIDADHVIAHSRIRRSRECPGGHVDFARLLTAAGAAHVEPATVSTVTEIRTIGNANLRAGAPTTHAPVAQTLPAGTAMAVAGFTTGEKVQGNSCWYLDGLGSFLWAGATDTPDPSHMEIGATDEMGLAGGGALPAPGIAIDRQKFRLPRGQYLDEVTAKDLLVLHFTAGRNAAGAFQSWAGSSARVATAYIVDMDGAIYETFDPSRWAYHLGIQGTHRHDRRSIGIEIANVGPLRLAADSLNWWPPEEKFQTPFCKLAESGRFVKAKYRNFDFYAAFPEEQLASVTRLVEDLCDRFRIPRRIAPEEKRAECDLVFFDQFRGIATHANFRRDKYDIGPAFDWSRLNASV